MAASLADRLKRRLVGTPVGSALESWRARSELRGATLATAGTVANDLLSHELLIGLARGAETFLDVGAHIGSVLARVQAASPATALVAVEAIPDKAAWLQRKFPRATIHPCAVGASSGEVSFFVDRAASGYSSLAPGQGTAEIRVPMRTLDSLVPRADVVKMDIEGAELGALRGARALLSNARPVLLFESAPGAGEKLGFTLGEMWDFWAGLDYELLLPHRLAHDGAALSREAYCESHDFPRRTTNYFAVPAERRRELRDRARDIVGID